MHLGDVDENLLLWRGADGWQCWSQLAAIREAYTEVRGETEAAKEELQQLQDSYRALQEQMATSLQQVFLTGSFLLIPVVQKEYGIVDWIVKYRNIRLACPSVTRGPAMQL